MRRSSPCLPKKDGEFHVREFARLPAPLGGRIQPFDSVARNAAANPQHRRHAAGDAAVVAVLAAPPKLKATEWLLEVMARLTRPTRARSSSSITRFARRTEARREGHREVRPPLLHLQRTNHPRRNHDARPTRQRREGGGKHPCRNNGCFQRRYPLPSAEIHVAARSQRDSAKRHRVPTHYAATWISARNAPARSTIKQPLTASPAINDFDVMARLLLLSSRRCSRNFRATNGLRRTSPGVSARRCGSPGDDAAGRDGDGLPARPGRAFQPRAGGHRGWLCRSFYPN